MKKGIDHAHFQKSIPLIKDHENYFVWNDDEQSYTAKDDADSNFILRVLQNPTSSDFKAPKKADVRAVTVTEANLKTHLTAARNNTGPMTM